MTYLLAVSVVFIWGVILQRMLNGADPLSLAPGSVQLNPLQKERLPRLQPDTFKLLLNYPDPFNADDNAATSAPSRGVKNIGSVGSTGAMPKPSSTGLPLAAPAKNPLEIVTYLGFVQNPASKNRIAIINFNGKEIMLSEGERVGELVLVSIQQQGVNVKIKSKLKYIKQSL